MMTCNIRSKPVPITDSTWDADVVVDSEVTFSNKNTKKSKSTKKSVRVSVPGEDDGHHVIVFSDQDDMASRSRADRGPSVSRSPDKRHQTPQRSSRLHLCPSSLHHMVGLTIVAARHTLDLAEMKMDTGGCLHIGVGHRQMITTTVEITVWSRSRSPRSCDDRGSYHRYRQSSPDDYDSYYGRSYDRCRSPSFRHRDYGRHYQHEVTSHLSSQDYHDDAYTKSTRSQGQHEVTPKPTKPKQKKRIVVESSDESDVEEVRVKKKSKKNVWVYGKGSDRPASRNDDLDEDLDEVRMIFFLV